MTPMLRAVSAVAAHRMMGAGPASRDQVIARMTMAASEAALGGTGAALQDGIRTTRQGQRNAQDGLAFLQLAAGVLEGVAGLLGNAAELGRRAGRAVSAVERIAADLEFQSTLKRIVDVSQSTSFNGLAVFSGAPTLTIAIDGRPPFEVTIPSLVDSESGALGMTLGSTSMATQSEAGAALALIEGAIAKVDASRTALAVARDQLASLSGRLGLRVENASAALTGFRQPDEAGDVIQLIRFQILGMSGATPQPADLQEVLSLLH
jgi:flagellin